jgi:predicted glycogen debranching enzyme
MDHLIKNFDVFEIFRRAADTFVKSVNGKVEIWAASRDWFLESWGRDTFISLPGILLVTGRFNEAREIIRNFANSEREGLIPNRIRSEIIEYNNVDGSLWFIQAAKKYLSYTSDWGFIEEMLPTIRNIMNYYVKGTGYTRFGKYQSIKMDDDGLVISPSQATWMDADPLGKGNPITPRNGKAVEINSLWYSNLKFLTKIERYLKKDDNDTEFYVSLLDRVKVSFNEKFWNEEEKALFDVVEGDPHKGAIRPNMVFAVSHCEGLLAEDRQRGVLNSAQNDLLTSGGLRTLSPRDSNYRGEYDTYSPIEQKDLAYHQGTIWPWLIGPYTDAFARIQRHEVKDEEPIKREICRIIAPLVRFCIESPYKSLPELFSGNPPYYPGGTTSQAWSVAEVFRILKEYKILG